MKKLAGLLALVALGACGADGDPIRPSLNSTISVSNSGVNIGASAALNKGPVTLSVGL